MQKTAAVARALGVSYHRLFNLVHEGKIKPRKDSSGDYVWSKDEVKQARVALAERDRKAKAKRHKAPRPTKAETIKRKSLDRS
jgi:predicted site-specific integrase-resolvase